MTLNALELPRMFEVNSLRSGVARCFGHRNYHVTTISERGHHEYGDVV